LCYLAFAAASVVFTRGPEHRKAGAALGDAGALLLPSVVIYLVSLLFVRRTLRGLTTGELAAGSILVAVFAPVLVAASFMLVYGHGSSQAADYAFFFVVPFVPPIVACVLALRLVTLWHRIGGEGA
jgi:hypothetical protein